jgi:predicted NBD/HSP70 family sugar kinase
MSKKISNSIKAFMPARCSPNSRETTSLGRKIDLDNFQAATVRTARDINRRIVLNLIRKHQPVSRAELSRHSRLQRSTVSVITEQLIAERWVKVGAFGDLPRGRKPKFLHLNGERAGVLGIDIRPEKTTIMLADLDMRSLAQESMATNADPDEFIKELCGCLRHLMSTNPQMHFEGIGVALPGRIDLASNRLVFAPNLAWKGVDLKAPLEAATGLPVELENAANACALAEIWGGAHSESVHNLVALTVSEGIGVGMILNGQLVRGATGLAGEFGHVSIIEDGPLCRCGNRGCLEACASNTAAIRYFTELESNQNGHKSETPPTFDRLMQLAEEGEGNAIKALERMAHYLGMGVAMMVTGLAPDVVVVVGDATRAWERVGPIIRDTVAKRIHTGMTTRIVPTDPVTQPRLRGTIALVLQKHFGVPHIL